MVFRIFSVTGKADMENPRRALAHPGFAIFGGMPPSPVIIASDCPPFQGWEERSGWGVVAEVARTSTTSGREGNKPHQR